MGAGAGVGYRGDQINSAIVFQTNLDVGFADADLPNAKCQPLTDIRLPLSSTVPADFRRNALEAAFDRDQRRVTRVGGGQFFTVAHDHLDRAAGGFGERVAKRNVHQRSFAAEVAAHRTDLEADFFFRQIEPLGEMRSSDVGTLSRTPDENAPGRFDIDDHGVGLEIAVMHARRGEPLFKNQLRFLKSLRDVAEDRLNVRMDVGNIGQRQTENFVAAQVLVQDRRLGSHGLDRVMDRFHFFIIDDNPVERLFGNLRRPRRDDSHPLADEAHGLLRQHRHVPQSSADQAARQVVGGEHGKNAFDVFREAVSMLRMRAWA